MSVPPLERPDDLTRFQWSVRALAQEPDMQVTLFPSFTCVPDELALEFDEHWRRLSEADLLEWFTPEQVKLIEELDGKLVAMSGPVNERFWNDEALRAAPEWSELRAAARRVLDAMAWPKTPPPAERDVYVGPDA